MTTLTVSKARANLYKLIDQANLTHEPTLIKGKRHSAMLVGEEDWRSIQETLYLVSIPGMRESIIQGLNLPLQEADEKLDW